MSSNGPVVIVRKRASSPIVACASPDYLSRHSRPSIPQDLTAHACLHFSGLRWGWTWQFMRVGEVVGVPILPRLACNNGPTLLAAALAGAGIALEPAFVVGPALRSGRLVPVLTEWHLPVIPLHAVYPANRNIARKVRSFVDMLAASFAAYADLGVAGN